MEINGNVVGRGEEGRGGGAVRVRLVMLPSTIEESRPPLPPGMKKLRSTGWVPAVCCTNQARWTHHSLIPVGVGVT